MTKKDILLKIAGCLFEVFGDYDKNLHIHKVEIKYNLLKRNKIRKIIIHSARPGIIIGRKRTSFEQLKLSIDKQFGYKIILEIKELEPIPIISSYSNIY